MSLTRAIKQAVSDIDYTLDDLSACPAHDIIIPEWTTRTTST